MRGLALHAIVAITSIVIALCVGVVALRLVDGALVQLGCQHACEARHTPDNACAVACIAAQKEIER